MPVRMTEPTTQRLRHEKETKNTHRYDAVNDGQPPAIGNLYVQKWALPEDPPEEILVTVDAVDRGPE